MALRKNYNQAEQSAALEKQANKTWEEIKQRRNSRPESKVNYKEEDLKMGPNFSVKRKETMTKPKRNIKSEGPKPEGNIASRIDNSDNTRMGPNMSQVNKPDMKPTLKEVEDKMKMARGAMKSAQGLLQRPTSPSDYKKGGKVKKMAKGGSVKSSASKRADGCATKGKTKGRFI